MAEWIHTAVQVSDSCVRQSWTVRNGALEFGEEAQWGYEAVESTL